MPRATTASTASTTQACPREAARQARLAFWSLSASPRRCGSATLKAIAETWQAVQNERSATKQQLTPASVTFAEIVKR